jgi:DNA-binding beta-propeller fold protein YncE
MWGAYGNTPPAEMAPNPSAPIQDQVAAETNKQFGLVHAVKVSQDGVVYVADRTHNRVQTFTTEGKFLKQARISVDGGVTPVPAGFAFSGDKQQRYLYVVDSGLNRIIIFERATMTQVGTVGSRGPMPGQFDIVHHMASDSKGNLYAAEIVTNRRAQRLLLQSAR